MENRKKDETKKDWVAPTVTEITEEDVLGGVPARFEAGALLLAVFYP
ncbi:MAG: hypothetical protein ACE5HR_07680 [bacterium]